jgi:raffinose/stachyose/melibiose transport system substrate-binding protein
MKPQKQFLILIFVVVFALVTTNCGGAPSASPVTTNPPPEQPTPPPAVEKATVPPTQQPVTEPVNLVFWWWGEEEAPGLEAWLKKVVPEFEQKNPGIKIETVRQTTDGLIPAAQAAMAAKQGPDIQYYWPVTWMQEDIWAGNLVALDDLIPEEVAHYIPAFRNHVSFKGKTYGMPLYNVGNPWVYNKEIFQKVGLDPENPPATWDEFLAAGEKLKAGGYIPIAAGMRDQWYADWPWMLLQLCTLDSNEEWFNTYLGVDGSKMTGPKYVETWTKWKELIDKSFFPKDVMSQDLYTGFDLFLQGKAAIASPVQPLMVQWSKQMGPEKLGVMLTPCWKESGLSKKFPTASQYVSITSFSKHQAEAAQFLKFLHEPEQMKSLYEMAGAMTADDRWNPEWITSGIDKQMYQWTQDIPSISLYYIAPPGIDDWIWPSAGKLYTGTSTPEQISTLGEQVLSAWRTANPELVASFKEWATINK